MICFSLCQIFLSVCAHFNVQCFDLYPCLDFSACLDFCVGFEFSGMLIRLSELILRIVFATKALDLPLGDRFVVRSLGQGKQVPNWPKLVEPIQNHDFLWYTVART